MSRDKQRLADYLSHILQSIERIERYTESLTDLTFLQDDLVQDAVVRNFEIIGEACRNIQRHHPAFATQHPEVPLAFAYEMRNALAHGYFQVDDQILWNTIQQDLPGLARQIADLAEQART